MRNLRSFACLAATSLCALSPALYGDTIERGGNDVDVQALREWINIKRQVTVKEIGGNLSISGEVRTKFNATGETIDNISQRGSGTPSPSREFNVNGRLMLDYRSDLTWASIKLEFNDRAGIVSGTTNKIKLSRAYFGARAFHGDSYYVDFEVGRKKLNSSFDSQLEFDSLFDGALAKYDQSFERVGDFYIHLGTFIINDTNDQFGYVGETGLLNIADSGFYTKISLIDWDTKNMHDELAQKRFDFIVSQMILGYKCYPAMLKKQITIYLAGLYNFKAKKLPITDYQKANWGSYVGFSIGELKRKGDWAIDANYQWLAAQCVPNFDVGGIGIGNATNTGFYSAKDDGTGGPNTRETAGGNVNYRGVSVTLNYLITNNINFQQQWSQSVTLDHDIGPSKRFKQYEIEFIYGF
ncbi:MAG: hypothetical protein V4489_08985 [Chlamydiota bacterium]